MAKERAEKVVRQPLAAAPPSLVTCPRRIRLVMAQRAADPNAAAAPTRAPLRALRRRRRAVQRSYGRGGCLLGRG